MTKPEWLSEDLKDLMIREAGVMPTESCGVCGEVASLLVDLARLMGPKQRAYGLANVVLLGGEGVLRRVEEKAARVHNVKTNGDDGGEESVEDSLLDMALLSLIALVVHEGRWPGAAWKGTKQSEVDRLRAEVASLRAQLAASAPPVGGIYVSPLTGEVYPFVYNAGASPEVPVGGDGAAATATFGTEGA